VGGLLGLPLLWDCRACGPVVPAGGLCAGAAVLRCQFARLLCPCCAVFCSFFCWGVLAAGCWRWVLCLAAGLVALQRPCSFCVVPALLLFVAGCVVRSVVRRASLRSPARVVGGFCFLVGGWVGVSCGWFCVSGGWLCVSCVRLLVASGPFVCCPAFFWLPASCRLPCWLVLCLSSSFCASPLLLPSSCSPLASSL
jgi:hypothetical protein